MSNQMATKTTCALLSHGSLPWADHTVPTYLGMFQNGAFPCVYMSDTEYAGRPTTNTLGMPSTYYRLVPQGSQLSGPTSRYLMMLCTQYLQYIYASVDVEDDALWGEYSDGYSRPTKSDLDSRPCAQVLCGIYSTYSMYKKNPGTSYAATFNVETSTAIHTCTYYIPKYLGT